MPVRTLIAGLSFVVLAAGALITPAASVPLGGLTVAVSPGGEKLVAGGDSRTLLVLDPKTLAVKDRIWIETTIVDLAFDNAGATLAVADTDGSVLLFDAAGWKKRAVIAPRSAIAFSSAADFVAGPDKRNSGSVSVFSMADGKEVSKLQIPGGGAVANLGFSADGKRLAVILRSKDGDEKKVAGSAIPKELKGLEREEFVLKNDGKVSELLIFDVASGKLLTQVTTFYSLDNSATVLFDGDVVVAVNYRNINARLAPDGQVTLFGTANSFNYGIGVTPDQKSILTGGLRAFSFTRAGGAADTKGELPKLPGWPEYFKGFTATADGKTIYAATTGYRVVRIGADGKVIAIEPVK